MTLISLNSKGFLLSIGRWNNYLRTWLLWNKWAADPSSILSTPIQIIPHFFANETLQNLSTNHPSMYVDELRRVNCFNMASKLSYEKYLENPKQKLTRKV